MVVIIEREPIDEPKNSEGFLKEISTDWLIVLIIFPFAGILGGLYYGINVKRGSDRLLVISLIIGFIWLLILSHYGILNYP